MSERLASSAGGSRTIDVWRRMIGREVGDLPTPAPVGDLAVVDRNIATLARWLDRHGRAVRPHIKVHKSSSLAHRQLASGASGIATATVWEALAMARSGIPDILVANQVVGEEKIAALVDAADMARVTVCVDDADNVTAISRAAIGHRPVGILVDVDVGMGRCGVRAIPAALALAKLVSRLDGLELRGLQGYEGHCMLIRDRDARRREAKIAMERLMRYVSAFRRAGHSTEVVSAGGTGTYDVFADYPLVTEIQAGSYVLMDTHHGQLAPEFDHALTIVATVISRSRRTAVLDVGRKSIGIDFYEPALLGAPGSIRFVAEEHTIVDLDSGVHIRVGDRVRVTPSYAPTTVNLHDGIYVTSDDRVIDVWTIDARGSGPI